MPKKTFEQAARALLDAARAIHEDNLHLLERLADDGCNLGIEFDCTLNGAQERIFSFFEALAAFRHGHVPWRTVEFMAESTDALVRALESRLHLPSAHAVGQAFRNSKVWWRLDPPSVPLPQKAYVKHLVTARETFYAALNTLNCDLFRLGSPPSRRKGKTKTGLKGKKTPIMARQLKTFIAFLGSRNYDGNESRLLALATQCWNANRKTWDGYKAATGSRKGYSSPKVLANAYRKSQ